MDLILLGLWIMFRLTIFTPYTDFSAQRMCIQGGSKSCVQRKNIDLLSLTFVGLLNGPKVCAAIFFEIFNFFRTSKTTVIFIFYLSKH